jgi:hypothetical protein
MVRKLPYTHHPDGLGRILLVGGVLVPRDALARPLLHVATARRNPAVGWKHRLPLHLLEQPTARSKSKSYGFRWGDRVRGSRA